MGIAVLCSVWRAFRRVRGAGAGTGFLEARNDELEFEAAGAAVQTVAVTSNVDWDCTMRRRVEGWISVKKEGTGGVAVAVADNSGVGSAAGLIPRTGLSPTSNRETDNGRSVRQQLYTVGGTRLAVPLQERMRRRRRLP